MVVSTGPGTTSFENDGDAFDGWTVPGAPADSVLPNVNDWIVGTAADGPPASVTWRRDRLLARARSSSSSPATSVRYPFTAAGGIVDDLDGLFFALETQTRPVYSKDFFGDSQSGDSVVVHELAHQWYGDSLAVEAWQHIWLNEGFATYAEWLWSEHEGLGTAQDNFDFFCVGHSSGRPVLGSDDRRSRARRSVRLRRCTPAAQ